MLNPANEIQNLLRLRRRPVGVKLQQSPPPEIPRVEEAAVSGCAYWKLAAQGATFYTEAEDHFGCPIGSHTHGVNLPAEKAKELEGLVGTMVDLQYIAMEEIPEIPQLEGPFGVAIYAPLENAPFEPDVVLLSGNARQMMLLAEAVHRAGLPMSSSLVGRPTCAAIPAVIQSGGTVTNLGCIGNRVYTELADDELYFVIAGSQLETLTNHLKTIAHANDELETFHRSRVAM